MKTDKIIAGLVALAIGLWALVSWWWFVVDILKGLVVLCLLFLGIILIGLGVKSNLDKYMGTEAQEEIE